MSGFLLDTNALLWLLSDSPELGGTTRAALRGGAPVHFSAVSILETTIKTTLGKLTLPGSPTTAAREAGLHELVFTSADAEHLAAHPDLSRHDPFDRMLLAQAERGGLTLVTSDRTLLAVRDARVLDARL